MRILFLLLLGLCVLGSVEGQCEEGITINTNPVSWEGRLPGNIKYLGGFELTSEDARFGGFSGMTLTDEQGGFAAVSDRGYVLFGQLRQDKTKHLTGVRPSAKILPIKGFKGEALSTMWRDSEAIRIDRKGRLYTSFERNDRVWRYGKPTENALIPEKEFRPAALSGIPFNSGLECLALAPNGDIIVLAEGKGVGGWRIQEDGTATHFDYVYTPNFYPTDIQMLPNGGLIVLERQSDFIAGFSARVVYIPSINVEGPLSGKELLHLSWPSPVDNMEDLAVHVEHDGSVLIYLMSDDNYRLWQRTLLLAFRWTP